MTLTPVDILHTQFKAALRGYSKGQVDEFVRAAREALEQALTEKTEMQHKVEMLQDEVDRIHRIESAMADALTMAQKSADEMKANAHRHAEMILQEAEGARVRLMVDAQREAEKYRGEIAILQATRDRFDAELRAMLSGYTEWLNRRVDQSAERGADAETRVSQEQRAEVA